MNQNSTCPFNNRKGKLDLRRHLLPPQPHSWYRSKCRKRHTSAILTPSAPWGWLFFTNKIQQTYPNKWASYVNNMPWIILGIAQFETGFQNGHLNKMAENKAPEKKSTIIPIPQSFIRLCSSISNVGSGLWVVLLKKNNMITQLALSCHTVSAWLVWTSTVGSSGLPSSKNIPLLENEMSSPLGQSLLPMIPYFLNRSHTFWTSPTRGI